MEKYDYREAVCDDIRTWIEDHEDWKAEYADESGKWLREDNREDIEEDLNDRLWAEDSVTGNASGSYTFNTWKAAENLCHNLDLLGEALGEFGYDGAALAKQMESAEGCDVTIRCYLLGQCIGEVLDEMQEDEE